MAKQLGETPAIVLAAQAHSQDGAQQSACKTAHDIADAMAGEVSDQPDSKKLTAQADLEDQTLPVPFATLPLDWHPFPHFYPLVNDGTSAFIDLQRPPPLA